MVETRLGRKTMPSVKPDDLTAKINSSHITTETKEILKLFMAMFSTIQLERDNKIKELDQKVASIQSTNTALEGEISEIKETTEHQFSVLRDEITSLKSKIKLQENTHIAHLDSLSVKIDSNEQYERRDALILSGPLVPEVSNGEDCKQLIQRMFRDHARLNINVSDISIAHRLGKVTRGPDKRNIIFKLCRRDLVQDIFAACKSQKPAFFVNTSLTPLRNKILYALRLLKRKFPTIVKGCRSTISGEVTVFVAPTGMNGGSLTEGTSTTTAPTSGSNLDAASETTPRSTSEATTSGGNRRGDRRLIINSKQQLHKFMTDHFNASLESLNVYW